MFATDFLFDDQRASDLGLMIVCFDGDNEPASGGEIEFNVVQTPNRDRYTYYGRQFASVLQWNFSIAKNPCSYVDNEEMYFTQYEESEIARWLLKKDGYNWFRFEQDGYNDIWYNVMFNMTPHQINGRTVGFDLVVESDCGYGFGAEEEVYFKEHEEIMNSSTPLYLYINSDIDTYVYPEITITGCSGDFYIYNESDVIQTLSNNKQSDFKNISDNIFMDSENDIVDGIDTAQDFNWKFIRLVKGVNVLKTDSANDLRVNIKYREPRRVIV